MWESRRMPIRPYLDLIAVGAEVLREPSCKFFHSTHRRCVGARKQNNLHVR